MPFGIIGRTGPGMIEAGRPSGVWGSVHGKEYFWDLGTNLGRALVTNGHTCRVRSDVALFPNWTDLLSCGHRSLLRLL